MFFKEHTYPQIFEHTGVPPSVYYTQKKNRWAKIKDKVDQKLLTNLRAKILSEEAGDILKKGAYIINLYFTKVIKRGGDIDNKDAKLTSDILANVHRLKQLEEGKPTDISFVEKMAPEEAMRYLMELQKEQVKQHEMSMFSGGDELSEQKLLEEYGDGDGDNSGVH